MRQRGQHEPASPYAPQRASAEAARAALTPHTPRSAELVKGGDGHTDVSAGAVDRWGHRPPVLHTGGPAAQLEGAPMGSVGKEVKGMDPSVLFYISPLSDRD